MPATFSGERVDRFVAAMLVDSAISRAKIQRAITDGQLQIDGTICTSPKHKLKTGQTISFSFEQAESSVTPEEGSLEVLYHDEHMIVVNKPARLTVHPAPSCPEGTLVHRLVHHFPELQAQEGFRPGIVHRIDKDTSGLLLVALTEEARLRLSEAFADRTINKEYLAIVKGVPATAEGEIDEPIGRHPNHKTRMTVIRGGREARSSWRVLMADPAGGGGTGWALTAVRIYTGRTHQIRVHMSHIGHSLWGDALYFGMPDKDELSLTPSLAHTANRQMLHAWKIAFDHPITGKPLQFTLPPPADFTAIIRDLGRRSQRVVLTGMPGCGKSAVLQLVKEQGIPTWSADACVAELYAPGGDAWHGLRGRFGDRFIPEDNAPVDKKAMLHAMQSDSNIRREIEEIVHPAVRYHLTKFWNMHKTAPLAAAEIPLFLETGWKSDADVLVGVYTPAAMRAERLRTTRGWNEEVIASMDAWQWPEADKMRACNLIIDNTGTEQDLKHKTKALLRTLETLREHKLDRLVSTAVRLWTK
ncbi:dephospho-CoA kinase [Oleidesulfovibrio sp.]|uniref:dephospho-CoA kinase n=1 Tax=Oleidesulfovibrio sp. TaxID=2909707 RepID=UPI003A83E293